ncbi:MAG: fdrA domain protein [Candidatus Hodarchaeales archaeon]|jgi:hypothetical protein
MNKKNLNSLLKEDPIIINIGLKSFHEANKDQEMKSVHVEWTPPAGGDKELLKLLDKLI